MDDELITQPIQYRWIGEEFQFGTKRVRFAQGYDPQTSMARTFLVDIETGKEVEGPIDLGSHVVHPQGTSGYPVHKVVDAEQEQKRLPQESGE